MQQNEVASHLEEGEMEEGVFPNDDKTQKYGNLLFLLQSEPRHIAHLCRLVSMSEIDSLLQTVMFTIYGNQYESREEHLLLTMFQVRCPPDVVAIATPFQLTDPLLLFSLSLPTNSIIPLTIPRCFEPTPPSRA
jgi:hypothetical protein